MRKLVLLTAAVAGLAFAGVAQAGTATPFGSATVELNHVKAVSDTSVASTPADDFGGVKFNGTNITGLTLNQLMTLSAEFNVTDDSCTQGSPRFEIDFAGTTNNLFVYLGTYSSTTGLYTCTQNTWIDSGNLMTSTDPRFDTSKFAGGAFYSTATQAKALLGTMVIDEIRFVVDGAFAGDTEQTVLLRKATINAEVFTWLQQLPPGMNAAQFCKSLRTAMGAEPFRQAWGTNTTKANALGKCVSHFAKMKSGATASATKACQREGKRGQELQTCVAQRSAATLTAKAVALRKAGVTCAKEQKTSGKASFRAKYGVGAAKLNAMKSCIAKHD